MRPNATLWKANFIAFDSSFCVMVIELIAARMLAPYIGVSLYTWTSIIGVILAGIALGNYLGGRVADRWASPLVLGAIFLGGGVATMAILPAIKLSGAIHLPSGWPLMALFVVRVAVIFLIPSIVLSMVSPVVIKLALADLGRTGGVVGTVYAFSTAGSILGTFLTGFYFILWFGTRSIVWTVAAVLILTGVLVWFLWRSPRTWKPRWKRPALLGAALVVVLSYAGLMQAKPVWSVNYVMESNYYTIQVWDEPENTRVLVLDHLVHSYVKLGDPYKLEYGYVKVFREYSDYVLQGNPSPKVLHLGGGGYSFPHYIEAAYPGSINDVIEIDPAVTLVAHQYLGLPYDTTIKTYNMDARLFLIEGVSQQKYDIVIGDVFNDYATPYHLTTLEFDQALKEVMKPDGVYLLNIIDQYKDGRYMPSMIHTLQQVFRNIYLFSVVPSWDWPGRATFVIAATDRELDFNAYQAFVTEGGTKQAQGNMHNPAALEMYLAERQPILLTDDHVPTDILMAEILR
ncbi:MAG: fused MFS/spermidine synthase [Chloroflexota bacterium]